MVRNIDQSLFHMHETGSVGSGTIALKGAPIVPLLEDHGETRERISLNSVVDSCEERVMRQLPGFELMFKADGEIKQKDLQLHAASRNDNFKVSVVTSPSGSYKEHDLAAFLGKWL